MDIGKCLSSYYALREKCYYFVQKQIKRTALWAYVTFPKGKKCYVVGTPTHTNIGDSAIVIAELAFLSDLCGAEVIKEITFEEYRDHPGILKTAISPQSTVCWHGGGNMGDQWWEEEKLRRGFLKQFDQRVMMFPQTIFYTATQQGENARNSSICVYNGKKNLTLVARERKSYELMKELYPETEILLAPDIVLSATMKTFGAEASDREGVLLCMRDDVERAMPDTAIQELKALLTGKGLPFTETDMYCEDEVTKENRTQRVKEKMEEFTRVKLVITDRLHGMVFAAITETPCIVFRNYNHKVYGTYEWIRHLPYIRFAESMEDVSRHLPELLAIENCRYDNGPLMPYFEQLAQVVKPSVCN